MVLGVVVFLKETQEQKLNCYIKTEEGLIKWYKYCNTTDDYDDYDDDDGREENEGNSIRFNSG